MNLLIVELLSMVSAVPDFMANESLLLRTIKASRIPKKTIHEITIYAIVPPPNPLEDLFCVLFY